MSWGMGNTAVTVPKPIGMKRGQIVRPERQAILRQNQGRTHMAEPTHSRVSHHPRISVFVLGLSLSLFLMISYVLCVIGYLVLPGLPIEHSALSIFLPGFALLSWRTFCLGAIESFAWGWYVALIFCPLFNFFAARVAQGEHYQMANSGRGT